MRHRFFKNNKDSIFRFMNPENMLKGRIAETLVEELLCNLGFQPGQYQ
jgi:hypothetical protein